MIPQTFWREGDAPIYDDSTLTYDDSDTLYDGEATPPRTQWYGDTGESSLDTWDDTSTPITDTWDNASDTWDAILDD